MVYDAPYLQNEFGDPQFFYVFNPILSFSICSESFEKICTWELLGANVLKRHTWGVVLPVNTGKGDGEDIDRIGVTSGLNLPLNVHNRARTHDQI